MLHTNQTLDLSPMGAKFIVRKTSGDTNGKSFDMEWQLEPHTMGAPVHIHPEAIETYTIIEGEMDVFLKDKWITARTGDRIVVEKGIPHTYKNSTDQPVNCITHMILPCNLKIFLKVLVRSVRVV